MPKKMLLFIVFSLNLLSYSLGQQFKIRCTVLSEISNLPVSNKSFSFNGIDLQTSPNGDGAITVFIPSNQTSVSVPIHFYDDETFFERYIDDMDILREHAKDGVRFKVVAKKDLLRLLYACDEVSLGIYCSTIEQYGLLRNAPDLANYSNALKSYWYFAHNPDNNSQITLQNIQGLLNSLSNIDPKNKGFEVDISSIDRESLSKAYKQHKAYWIQRQNDLRNNVDIGYKQWFLKTGLLGNTPPNRANRLSDDVITFNAALKAIQDFDKYQVTGSLDSLFNCLGVIHKTILTYRTDLGEDKYAPLPAWYHLKQKFVCDILERQVEAIMGYHGRKKRNSACVFVLEHPQIFNNEHTCETEFLSACSTTAKKISTVTLLASLVNAARDRLANSSIGGEEGKIILKVTELNLGKLIICPIITEQEKRIIEPKLRDIQKITKTFEFNPKQQKKIIDMGNCYNPCDLKP